MVPCQHRWGNWLNHLGMKLQLDVFTFIIHIKSVKWLWDCVWIGEVGFGEDTLLQFLTCFGSHTSEWQGHSQERFSWCQTSDILCLGPEASPWAVWLNVIILSPKGLYQNLSRFGQPNSSNVAKKMKMWSGWEGAAESER